MDTPNYDKYFENLSFSACNVYKIIHAKINVFQISYALIMKSSKFNWYMNLKQDRTCCLGCKDSYIQSTYIHYPKLLDSIPGMLTLISNKVGWS